MHASAVFSVTLGKESHHPFLDVLGGMLKMTNNVADQSSLLLGSHYMAVKITGLFVVTVGVVGHVSTHDARDLVGSSVGLRGVRTRSTLNSVGPVIRSRSLIAIYSHVTVALVIANAGSVGAVDGDLQIISAQTVAVSVSVREETPLKHSVERRLDARNEGGRLEGSLLDLGKVIFGISVQNHLANRDQRVILVRPYFGDVERIPLVFPGVFEFHDLNVDGPRGEPLLGNGLEQILLRVVSVFSCKTIAFLLCEVFNALIGLEVILDPVGFSFGVDVLEGVAAVAIHVAVALGNTTVREQDGDLMKGLGG